MESGCGVVKWSNVTIDYIRFVDVAFYVNIHYKQVSKGKNLSEIAAFGLLGRYFWRLIKRVMKLTVGSLK